MCELEGGAGCALFPCGAAAVANTILAFVEQGDHVLMTNTAYEPSQDFCTKILGKLGVSTGWFDPLIGADIVSYAAEHQSRISGIARLCHHGSS
jgi:cystathionine beta-lyase